MQRILKKCVLVLWLMAEWLPCEVINEEKVQVEGSILLTIQ